MLSIFLVALLVLKCDGDRFGLIRCDQVILVRRRPARSLYIGDRVARLYFYHLIVNLVVIGLRVS